MSADNWTTCPKCRRTAERERAEKIASATARYGQDRPEDWLYLMREAEKPLDLKETLREDYYIGVDDEGRFVARYCCRCEECGFAHEFEHAAELLPLDTKG
jgi:hypothetical protein